MGHNYYLWLCLINRARYKKKEPVDDVIGDVFEPVDDVIEDQLREFSWIGDQFLQLLQTIQQSDSSAFVCEK